jgi:molecular chaperone HscB
MEQDYFAFFGLPTDLAIDLKDLEKRFLDLSRRYHPDLNARKPAAEREQALEASAILNDAYRTLRDPIARAMYLLKREGFDVGEQTTKDVPPELLEEVFELNMALEELKAGDTDALPQIAEARGRFETMRSEVDEEIQSRFGEWDAGHKRESLGEIRSLLNRRKYVSNLIDKTNVPD